MAEPFLRLFQSDKPLALSMYRELEKMLYGLMQKFIKRDILDANKSMTELMKLDLNNKKCHKKEVKIGLAT